MLVRHLGELQCLALSLLSLAFLTTCSQAAQISSISNSMSSGGPPYGNTTSKTLQTSSSMIYSNTSATTMALSTFLLPIDSTSSVSFASNTIMSSSIGLGISSFSQTGSSNASFYTGSNGSPSAIGGTTTLSSPISSRSSMTAAAFFGNGTSTSSFPASTAISASTTLAATQFSHTVSSPAPSTTDTEQSASLNESSSFKPVSIITTALVSNITLFLSTGSSSSEPLSAVLSMGTTIARSGTASLSFPTGSANSTFSSMASIASQVTSSSRNGTIVPSITTLPGNGTSVPSNIVLPGDSSSTSSVLSVGPQLSPKLTIGTFKYLGCASSSSSFASFSLVDTNAGMTLELCISNCGASQYTYAGVSIERCYCANSISSDVTITPGPGSCNVLCPGDTSEICGGLIGSSEGGLMARKLQNGNLLSLFANLAAAANSTSSSSMSTVTIASSLSRVRPLNSTILSSTGIPQSTGTPSSRGSGNSTLPSSVGIVLSTGLLSSPGSSNLTLGSSNLTLGSLMSTVPSTSLILGTGLGNSSTLTRTTTNVVGSPIAPFANGTSSLLLSSTLSPSSIPSDGPIIASSTAFGNGSSAPSFFSSISPVTSVPFTKPANVTTSARAYTTITTTYTILSVTPSGTFSPTRSPSSSFLSTILEVSGLASSVENGITASASLSLNPTNFVGYTITEIVYTTVSSCPTTINTVISGMLADIVTNSLSTIILTSTIMVPCNKCLNPSQLITLPPASTTTDLYETPSPWINDMNEVTLTKIVYTTVSTCPITMGTTILSGSTSYFVTETVSTLTLTQTANVNEVVVTEIIYTTISTCPITIGISTFAGSTSYQMSEIVSTLTLTATTTAHCQICRPGYATVTIMLVGGPMASTPGSGIVGFSASSPLIYIPVQSAVSSGDSPSCLGCATIANGNAEVEAMGVPSSLASPGSPTFPAFPARLTANPASGVQLNVESAVSGDVPITDLAASLATATSNITIETSEMAAAAAVIPTSLSSLAQANVQSSADSTVQIAQVAASAAFTSAPVNNGSYFTGGSDQNLNEFSQTIIFGITVIVTILSML